MIVLFCLSLKTKNPLKKGAKKQSPLLVTFYFFIIYVLFSRNVEKAVDNHDIESHKNNFDFPARK